MTLQMGCDVLNYETLLGLMIRTSYKAGPRVTQRQENARSRGTTRVEDNASLSFACLSRMSLARATKSSKARAETTAGDAMQNRVKS